MNKTNPAKARQQVEDLREIIRIVFTLLDVPMSVYDDEREELRLYRARVASATGWMQDVLGTDPLNDSGLAAPVLGVLRGIAERYPVTYRVSPADYDPEPDPNGDDPEIAEASA